MKTPSDHIGQIDGNGHRPEPRILSATETWELISDLWEQAFSPPYDDQLPPQVPPK
jgi:hypothetical protein